MHPDQEEKCIMAMVPEGEIGSVEGMETGEGIGTVEGMATGVGIVVVEVVVVVDLAEEDNPCKIRNHFISVSKIRGYLNMLLTIHCS